MHNFAGVFFRNSNSPETRANTGLQAYEVSKFHPEIALNFLEIKNTGNSLKNNTLEANFSKISPGNSQGFTTHEKAPICGQ